MNLTINNVINDLIEKVVNLAIKNVGNNLIDKFKNLIINNTINDSNRTTMSDVQL